MMKRLSIVLAVAAAFMFSLSSSIVMAQPVDYCEGNFDNDQDQDGTDAFVFKQDFGRSSLLNPCPVIECQTAEQLEMRIAQLEAKLAKVTVSENGNDITFSGVNVHIVDGSGDTWGDVNGLGNLIVGYNELREDPYVNDRTGSHNIMVGPYHNYSSYGGLVAGDWNTISGPCATVSGGVENVSSGAAASVSGGSNNTASGLFASVSGGENNTANGNNASVGGGGYNVASGDNSFVGGGGGVTVDYGNKAFGDYSAILGGTVNIAGDPTLIDHSVGEWSTVSGGYSNTASGQGASVSGGTANTASGGDASVSGGMSNTANGNNASVSGGQINYASGVAASVSGGEWNDATGSSASVSGGGASHCSRC